MKLPTDDAATLAAQPARERVLNTAIRLFYRHGVNAVGIDRIIAEAGVAKASFYKHFHAKEELVAAYLYRRHEGWMAWFAAALTAACEARGPSFERVAEVLALWFADADFRGCAFINIVADGSASAEAVSVVQSHKHELQDALQALARRLAHPHPNAAAQEALLIVEGSIVRAQVGDGAAASTAARLLRRLDAEC